MAERAVRKKKKKSGVNIVTLALCFFIVLFGVSIISQQSTLSKLSAEKSDLEQKIAEQQDEQTKINKQLEAPNELDRVEQIAREQLGMLKPGERVFVDSSR
ncbi:MAG: cell division protein FtsL [Clostridia bacterium]|nr:cell division protein FtsL [Clostridia bacterium]